MNEPLLTLPYRVLVEVLGAKEVDMLILKSRLHAVEREVRALRAACNGSSPAEKTDHAQHSPTTPPA